MRGAYDAEAVSQNAQVNGIKGLFDRCGATQADVLFHEYATNTDKDGNPAAFESQWKPFWSTMPFPFVVVEAHPSAGPTMAHAKLPAGTTLDFFGFGQEDVMPNGIPNGIVGSGTVKPDDSDTNLDRGKTVPGPADFAFDAISLSAKGHRVVYPAAQLPSGETIADQVIAGVYSGSTLVYDPGSLVLPPEVMSPANLEETLLEALKPNCFLTFLFDRSTNREIGRLDSLPEGAAKSLLRASGDPNTLNRMHLPEGYLWRGEGSKSSTTFRARVTVVRDVVVPIDLLTGLLGTTQSPRPIPSVVILDVTMRLHGIECRYPSEN